MQPGEGRAAGLASACSVSLRSESFSFGQTRSGRGPTCGRGRDFVFVVGVVVGGVAAAVWMMPGVGHTGRCTCVY